MEKIRIQNLRSLKDTKNIDLRPLTVLVGKNSSGKSTLLRFFPLMKQTIETKTNEPILWYSPSYVDFGSFEESLNYNSENKLISFEFDFKLAKRYLQEELTSTYWVRKYQHFAEEYNDYDDKLNISLKIVVSKKYINRFEIKIWDQVIEFNLTDKYSLNHSNVQILINGEPIKGINFISNMFGSYTNMDLLPGFYAIEEEKITSSEKLLKENIFTKISEFAHVTTRDSTIEDAIESLKLGDSNYILNSLRSFKSTSKQLDKKLNSLEIDDPDFIEIKNNFLGLVLNTLIEICNKELKLFFSSVKYIAPLRASAERYYRIQGLALDEIDPQGANIPMLLNNMSVGDRKNFNKWIKQNFNFEIISSTSGGHTSLFIKYANGFKINLADTGFGYSQILPIILVLWQATQKSQFMERYKKLKGFNSYGLQRDNNFTIVIEQPELHLHPSLQGMLIDAFAKIIMVSNDIGIQIKILIETHSETMINRIGQLIAENYEGFNKDLVNVLIFNTSNSYSSEIFSTSYTEEGHLSSWPIGFFSPEEI